MRVLNFNLLRRQELFCDLRHHECTTSKCVQACRKNLLYLYLVFVSNSILMQCPHIESLLIFHFGKIAWKSHLSGVFLLEGPKKWSQLVEHLLFRSVSHFKCTKTFDVDNVFLTLFYDAYEPFCSTLHPKCLLPFILVYILFPFI